MDVIALFGFALCAAVIFVGGRGLSFHGDRIAELSGLGGALIGLVLMAFVTSLPELVVGISSSAVVGSPDLAVGDVLGSCAFNLLILASLDAFAPPRKRLLGLASASHVLAAALGIVLLALVGLGLVTRGGLELTPWIGVTSVLFIAVYLASLRLIHLHARRLGPDGSIQEPLDDADAPTEADGESPLKHALVRYAAWGAVVVVAALFLPPLAQRIALSTGLAESFVGTLFVAASTSLPEIAVSLSAVRMGAIDLAVGNMLGSNLFNIAILAIDDIVYTPGLLLADASPSHLVSVLSTMAMSAIVIIGLTFQVTGKRFLLAWDAALVLLVYVANAALLLTLPLG